MATLNNRNPFVDPFSRWWRERGAFATCGRRELAAASWSAGAHHMQAIWYAWLMRALVGDELCVVEPAAPPDESATDETDGA